MELQRYFASVLFVAVGMGAPKRFLYLLSLSSWFFLDPFLQLLLPPFHQTLRYSVAYLNQTDFLFKVPQGTFDFVNAVVAQFCGEVEFPKLFVVVGVLVIGVSEVIELDKVGAYGEGFIFLHEGDFVKDGTFQFGDMIVEGGVIFVRKLYFLLHLIVPYKNFNINFLLLISVFLIQNITDKSNSPLSSFLFPCPPSFLPFYYTKPRFWVCGMDVPLHRKNIERCKLTIYNGKGYKYFYYMIQTEEDKKIVDHYKQTNISLRKQLNALNDEIDRLLVKKSNKIGLQKLPAVSKKITNVNVVQQ